MSLRSLLELSTIASLLVVSAALAQTGDGYDLTWSTVDTGADAFSAGSGYELSATIGQADAEVMTGGGFTLTGGFLPGVWICTPHPADADGDQQMTMNEATGYGAFWTRGDTWPLPPNPIPIGHVTRAGYLWKKGEVYCCNLAQPEPLLWIPCPGGPSTPPAARPKDGEPDVASWATRTLSGAGYTAERPVRVAIAVAPGADVAVYAAEERPPAGWTVTNISHDGEFDAATGKVKWGLFFDNKPRTLTYDATPPEGESGVRTFRGAVSADGAGSLTGGRSALTELRADFDGDGDVDSYDFIEFQGCFGGPSAGLVGAGCEQMDLDGDNDVDVLDFHIFVLDFTGPQTP